jgi:hypothetical protein
MLMRGGVEEAVDPAMLTTRINAPADGMVISTPPTWTAVAGTRLDSLSEEVSVTAAAPSSEALNTTLERMESLQFAVDTPVFLAMVSDAADMPGVIRSPRVVFELFKAEIPILEDLTFGPTRSTTAGENDAVYADFNGEGQSGNGPFAGRIVTVLWADRVGFFVGVAPTGQWEAFHPTFNGMIQSIGLYDPVAIPGS